VTEKHYEWSLTEDYPVIKQHSIAKHDILHAYLVAYIQTLVSHPSQEEFRLTLIDGFAGGGVYRHVDDNREIQGSPFRMLKAVEEAGFLVNRERRKRVTFHLDYFFIEENRGAFEVLNRELERRDYGHLMGQHIYPLHSCFQDQAAPIIEFVKRKSHKAARAIFLLDQYGYSDVPAQLIRDIITELPGSEIILTFAVDALLNFVSDTPTTQKLLEKIGVPEVLRGRRIEDIKSSERDWRLFIQSCLYKDIVEACGARFYTLFFIRSSRGHGDYWLIHLSQRPRARDVMTRIHWEKNNHFIHYGGAGLDMFQALGYLPEKDGSYTGQTTLDEMGFCFDEPAKEVSIDTLTEQIPRLIYPDPEGMTFAELFTATCNSSPASSRIYRQALERLLQLKDIEVISHNGERRKSSNIHDTDRIQAPRQTRILF
jgi:three-Cys-motif partner protein